MGQVDDTSLLCNDIHQLQRLLDLVLIYCQKRQVQLSAGKTKPLLFCNKETCYTKYTKHVSRLRIGETPINFVETAEHVGVLRSVSGNLMFYQIIDNHKRSPAPLLLYELRKFLQHQYCSLAQHHFLSPSLNPISLPIAHHVKETTENLLKLHFKTPDPVVFFFVGMSWKTYHTYFYLGAPAQR